MRAFSFRKIAIAVIGFFLMGTGLSADTVQGYVIHGTSGMRLSGVEVTLYALEEGPLREMGRDTTDTGGRFSFSDPLLKSGSRFVLAASYQDVPHFSSPLAVGAQQEVILEVYEPTQDAGQIRIRAHTIFLTLDQADLDVAHLVQVANDGMKTYVGRSSGRVTEFILPSGLTRLQSHAGSLVRVDENRFFDTQPLPPGTTQIAFTFSMDLRQMEKGYLHKVSYPTDRLEIFLQPSTFQPGPPFEDLGVIDLHGSLYRHLQVSRLEPGRELLVPLPIVRSMRWLLKWAALGTMLLSGIAVFFLGRDRISPESSSESPSPRMDLQSLRQRQKALLERLARLDEAYSGREDDPAYRTERDQLMRQAVTAFRLLEVEGRDENG